MKLEYPESETSIDDMCEIIKFFGIEAKKYTDCAIVYEITFDTLRAVYNLGKDHALSLPAPEMFPGTLDALNKLGCP